MVQVEDESFVMADIPGIIEGAHTGAGLGHEFLRHIERTRLLLHVLDISGSEERDPVEDFKIINRELLQYSPVLAQRPMIVVPNKTDLNNSEQNLLRLKDYLKDSFEIFPISAVTGEGLDKLLHRVIQVLPNLPPVGFTADPDLHRYVQAQSDERFIISQEYNTWVIKGKEIEKHAAMSYLETDDGLMRFQNILKVMGVDNALREKGIKEGDRVVIGKLEMEWSEGG